MTSKNEILQALGITEAEAKYICNFSGKMYKPFRIPKRSGEDRLILAPDRRLKFIQRKLACILNKSYSPRAAAHGFIKGKSHKTNAQNHVGRKHILNIDLANFFPTITSVRIERLLTKIGFSQDASEIITGICTVGDFLPQGAPTSPVISNMICFRMDNEFVRLAKSKGARYSRYADDITLSTNKRPTLLFQNAVPPAGKIAKSDIATDITNVIFRNGFSLNHNKLRYFDGRSRREVTGLITNEFVNVDRRYVRNLRSAYFSIEKDGIAAAQAKFANRFKEKSQLIDVVRGKTTYLGQIRGRSDDLFRKYAQRFNNLGIGKNISIEPSAVEKRQLSIWVIEYLDSFHKCHQGTAFFLDGWGLVTAHHCVDGGTNIYIYQPSAPTKKFPVTINKKSEHHDLAILNHSIGANQYYNLPIANTQLDIGDKVAILGYPDYGPGDTLSIRTGAVTAKPTKSLVLQYEIDASIAKGFSGGPLTGLDQSVVGVCHKGGAGEDRNIAVRIKHIVDVKGFIASYVHMTIVFLNILASIRCLELCSRYLN